MRDNERIEDNAEEAIANEEASLWVARHDRGLLAEEQDTFFDWLKASPINRKAYENRLAAWRKLKGLAVWKPEYSAEVIPDLLKPLSKSKASRLRRWTMWGLAAAATIVVAVVASWLVDWEKDEVDSSLLFTANKGEALYRRHLLSDGSMIELNEGSRVSVHYSKGERVVNLLAGEAYFDVSKDPYRPFLVIAGGAVVQAVGTAFNVTLDNEDLEVLVTEGSVAIRSDLDFRVDLKEKLEPLIPALSAGQLSRIRAGGEAENNVNVEKLSAGEVEQRLAWKRIPVLNFEDAPLEKLVETFNLYNETQIEIADSDLKSLVVNAALKPDNIEGLVRLMEMSFDTMSLDANIERANDRVVIRLKR